MAKRSLPPTSPARHRGAPAAVENPAETAAAAPRRGGRRAHPPAEPEPASPPPNDGSGASGGTLLTVGHPIFAEPTRSQDPLAFGTPHPSDNAVYAKIEKLLTTQVVAFPKSRIADDALFALSDAYGPRGPDVVDAIKKSGRIVFHSVGDTGCSDARRYHEELRVSDQMTMDAGSTEASNRPAFFLHLGDVVYNFGEARYYYDQFYEPFRAYPGPVIAMAGNHDSFVVPGTPPADTPLVTFARNFCSEQPVITTEAGSLHRTAMTAPGVYYALDAPFVRIICLFSNALEDPGVISSEGGKWPNVPDTQLAFLHAQFKKIKQQKYAGAVLLATHHPPFSYAPQAESQASGGNHDSSSAMLAEIDKVCMAEGVYPHAVLSAHAHNYQRYTRTVSFAGGQHKVPFVVCGSGGHNINPLVRGTRKHPEPEPENASDVSYLDGKPAITTASLVLDKYDDHEYGYLRISVDAQHLRIAYHQVGVRSLLQSRFDLVTVDIAQHTISSNS